MIALGTIGLQSSTASAAGLPDWLTFWEDDPYVFNGGYYDPPREAFEFPNAVDHNGEPFSLEANAGKVIFFYFGYTNCPDACPATLAEWREVKAELGDEAENVVFAFVTVDPERDTQDRLGEYMGFWDPEFLGVSMNEEDTESVASQWGIQYSYRESTSASGYLVDHDTATYVVDTHGDLRLTYPLGFAPEDMAEDINYLLNDDD